MNPDTKLDELLLHWQEMRDQGVKLSPEELCATDPKLVTAARERIRVLTGIAGMLESSGTLKPNFAFLAPAQQEGELGRLAHYRVLALIGEGGMGLVYRAQDVRLEREVALKVVRPEEKRQPQAVARFFREARALAAVEHVHLTAIYDVGEDRNVPYLAMQLLRGEPLHTRLRRVGRLPVAAVLRLGKQAARGLAAAHERGLVHRDIKPANIFLEAGTDDVKILDFGLARSFGDQPGLTNPGVVAGTPAYMAPEQARAEKLDARADLFSLGCVLYESATGKSPFWRDEVVTTLRALELEEAPEPRSLVPEIPESLNVLLVQLLNKAPAGRPKSAATVAAALEEIEQELAGDRPRRRSRPLNRRTIGIGVALAALVAIGAAGIYFATRPGTTRDQGPAPLQTSSTEPYVLQARPGEQERRFATLPEALVIAAAGATIDIDRDGPLVVDRPLRIERPVRIRAAPGRRPVLQLRADAGPRAESCLDVAANLVLEGLEIHHRVEHRDKVDQVIEALGGELTLAHVRLIVDGEVGGILMHGRDCRIIRSQVVASRWSCVGWTGDEAGSVTIDGSILAASPPLTLHLAGPESPRFEVRLRGTTLHSDYCVMVLRVGIGSVKDAALPLVKVAARDGVFSGHGARVIVDGLVDGELFERDKSEGALTRLMHWKDERNAFSTATFIKLVDRRNGKDDILSDVLSIPTLADWQRLWNEPNAKSRQGRIRFGDDDFVATFRGDPLLLTPPRFRLAIGSEGQGQGANGGDLGADVDQVGPGAAYERWRGTVDYRELSKKLGFDDR